MLLERSLLFHCSVCLAELATGVANYDPARPDWRRVRDYYTALFDTIPDSRILSPDDQAWIDAGVIAGSLSRIQNFHKDQRKECLNDALIYLTAAKAGLSVRQHGRLRSHPAACAWRAVYPSVSNEQSGCEGISSCLGTAVPSADEGLLWLFTTAQKKGLRRVIRRRPFFGSFR